ncbi:MAG: hypothetical protein FJ267_15150, partial [Planctomycetes bacterium]|nr:hypothetical protein [Planctomycetota bacterium]
MEDVSEQQDLPRTTGRVWPWVKRALFLIVILFIGRRAWSVWQESPHVDLQLDKRWLIPASLFYLVGWLPSVWYWRWTMSRMGANTGWFEAIRAYYVGSMGKYVPGKALVLILRGTLLKEAGVTPLVAGVTALYETLIYMAAGAAIALALVPLNVPRSLIERLPAFIQNAGQHPWLFAVIVIVGTLATTPLSARLFTIVARAALPRDWKSSSSSKTGSGVVVRSNQPAVPATTLDPVLNHANSSLVP